MSDLTVDPSDARLGHGSDEQQTSQNDAYLILSDEERSKGYVRPVRLAYVHKTCGTVTRMSLEIAQTYAHDPKFYGSTYCVHCRMHRPVSEFVWNDGSNQAVGS